VQGNMLGFLFSGIFLPVFLVVVVVNVVEILLIIESGASKHKIMIFLRSLLFTSSVLFMSVIALSVSCQLLFSTASPARAALSSSMLTRWDHAIFGLYPWLSIHAVITATWLQKFIFQSYLYLDIIILVLLGILVFKNVYLFRKLLLSYFIVSFVGIPFWASVPAVAPDMMYKANILNVPIEAKLKQELDQTKFSPLSLNVFSALEGL